MDSSPPGSSVHGIFQARILEWVTVPSSRGSSQFRNQTHSSGISCIQADSLPSEPPGKPISTLRPPKPCFHQLMVSECGEANLQICLLTTFIRHVTVLLSTGHRPPECMASPAWQSPLNCCCKDICSKQGHQYKDKR